MELTDNGKISEIRGHWIRESSACNDDETHPSDTSKNKISLKSFKVLFAITGGVTATCLMVFLVSYLYQNRDFIQTISDSGTTTWSKICAMCKHFDQRDPKSFLSGRAKEDGENTSSNQNGCPARSTTVVPVEEMASENAEQTRSV